MRKIALSSLVLFLVPFLAAISLVALSSEANAAVNVVCFKDLFERKIGQPRHEHNVFPAIAGPATVKIYNGDGGWWLDRATVANVIINGKVIFRASDFNKKVKYLEKQVNLLEGENSIDVNLLGMPGVRIRVEIIQGMEAEAAAIVGPEGGIIAVANKSSPLYGIKINIPSGTVDKENVFSISVIDEDFDPPYEGYDIFPVFKLSPENTRFKIPIQISFPYNDNNNDGKIDGIEIPEKNIVIFTTHENEELWETVNIIEFNEKEKYIVGSFNHFSYGRVVATNSSEVNYNLPSAMFKAFYETDAGSYSNYQDIDDFIHKCQVNGIDMIIVEGFTFENGVWYIVPFDNSPNRPNSSLAKFDLDYLISKALTLPTPISVYASINCFNPDRDRNNSQPQLPVNCSQRIDPDCTEQYNRLKNTIIPYFLERWPNLSGIYLDRIRYGHSAETNPPESILTNAQKQKVSDLVEDISQFVKSKSKKLGAFTQPGRFGGSDYNGQMLVGLAPYLDFISPMSYSDSNQALSYNNTLSDTFEAKISVDLAGRTNLCKVAPILNTYDKYDDHGNLIEIYQNNSFENAILGAINGGANILEYFRDEHTDTPPGPNGEWKIICSYTATGNACDNATLYFFDNFNSENGGVAINNYSSFTNWNVAIGSVDLVGSNGGPGMFVDLDGSTLQNGTLTSKQNFVFESGKLYTLSFSLAASPNIYASTVYVQVASGALLNETITRYTQVLYGDPIFADYSYTFSGNGTSGRLSFTDGGGGSNTGMYLDNVKLVVNNP